MRALLLVLDSLAVGSTLNGWGTPGPDTLGRLFAEVPDLDLPTLFSLGLGEIMKGRVFDPPARKCAASYGRMRQRSAGADRISGLWELAGTIPGCPFTVFAQPPKEFTEALARRCGVEFLMGCDETELPGDLQQEHLRTGSPILTFGADSTLHLAAHETVVSPALLTRICRAARSLCDEWRIACVTGQSMTGKPGVWKAARAPFRFSMVPPRTLLNAVSDKGLAVEAIGGIHEVFARSGVTHAHPAASTAESLQTIEQLWEVPQNGLIFASLGFSSDTAVGFARALEAFDGWLAGFLEKIDNDNLLILTGSNGDGPGAFCPDAPRQELPVLVRYGGRTAPLGLRETCADVAATLGAFFEVEEQGRAWPVGERLITFHRPKGLNGPW